MLMQKQIKLLLPWEVWRMLKFKDIFGNKIKNWPLHGHLNLSKDSNNILPPTKFNVYPHYQHSYCSSSLEMDMF